MVFHSHSPEETKHLAETIAMKVVALPTTTHARVVKLKGDLGAGKTTFTQGFAKALGIARKITSPTFVIMKRHITKHGYYKNLFHLDAYRVGSIEEMEPLKFAEILEDPKNVILIEWPENLGSKILPRATTIHILHGKKENERTIRISGT